MSRPGKRVAAMIAACVMVPFLALTSTLAPVHAHEPDGDGSQSFVHSHFEPHESDQHHPDGDRFDHGEGHVVWLETSLLQASASYVVTPPAVTSASFDRVHVLNRWSIVTFEQSAPIHGPPRFAPVLRGPPLSLA